MLNQEGWSLLLLIALLLGLLGLGWSRMGRERSMAEHLRACGGAADAAAGVALRCAGPLLLAVIPGAVYQHGLVRAGAAVSAGAGLVVLLTVLVPKLRRRCPDALTLPQALSARRGVRAALACLCGLQALIVAAGALTLTARILAGVFSLHYTIALAAAAASCLLLTALCGAQARLRMDRALGALLVLALVAIPAATVMLNPGAGDALLSGLYREQTGVALGIGLASDALWALGALGLALPAQRLLAAGEGKGWRAGGAVGGGIAAALMLLTALTGLLGRAVDDGLVGAAAAETVLMQMAQSPRLMAPLCALLTGVLLTALLCLAQDALRALGGWISWDVVQPVSAETRERPLARWMLLTALLAGLAAFALGLNPNLPLALYAQAAGLLGAVLAPSLLLRACGREVHPLGAYCGLALGTLMAIVWMAVPALRETGLLGALPCAGLSALLQGFVRERAAKTNTK